LTPVFPTEMPGFVLYTHINFSFSYNGDRITKASASPGKPVALVSGLSATLRFSYSVTWQPTDFPYERRLDPQHNRYKEIQWFGIINGLCSTLLLTVLFYTILLRAALRDVRKYTRAQGDDEAVDDAGWKQIHGDVFRHPSGLIIFCPARGAGVADALTDPLKDFTPAEFDKINAAVDRAKMEYARPVQSGVSVAKSGASVASDAVAGADCTVESGQTNAFSEESKLSSFSSDNLFQNDQFLVAGRSAVLEAAGRAALAGRFESGSAVEAPVRVNSGGGVTDAECNAVYDDAVAKFPE
jgi:Endomembrane protein 70